MMECKPILPSMAKGRIILTFTFYWQSSPWSRADVRGRSVGRFTIWTARATVSSVKTQCDCHFTTYNAKPQLKHFSPPLRFRFYRLLVYLDGVFCWSYNYSVSTILLANVSEVEHDFWGNYFDLQADRIHQFLSDLLLHFKANHLSWWKNSQVIGPDVRPTFCPFVAPNGRSDPR